LEPEFPGARAIREWIQISRSGRIRRRSRFRLRKVRRFLSLDFRFWIGSEHLCLHPTARGQHALPRPPAEMIRRDYGPRNFGREMAGFWPGFHCTACELGLLRCGGVGTHRPTVDFRFWTFDLRLRTFNGRKRRRAAGLRDVSACEAGVGGRTILSHFGVPSRSARFFSYSRRLSRMSCKSSRRMNRSRLRASS